MKSFNFRIFFVILLFSTCFSSCEMSIQGIEDNHPRFCILKFNSGEDFSNNVYSCEYNSKQYINSDPTNIVPLHGGFYAIQYGVQALQADLCFYTVNYSDFESVFKNYGCDAKRFCTSEKSYCNPFAEWYESYGYGCGESVHQSGFLSDGCDIDTVAINKAIDEGRMTECFVKIK